MYFLALLTFACAIISALLAYLWHRAPRAVAEHWTVRRKREAKVRAGKRSALYLSGAAMLLGSIAQFMN